MEKLIGKAIWKSYLEKLIGKFQTLQLHDITDIKNRKTNLKKKKFTQVGHMGKISSKGEHYSTFNAGLGISYVAELLRSFAEYWHI